MNNSDKIKFGEIMMGLAENFSSTLGDIGLKMRFEVLKGYSIEDIEGAAMVILRTRKYTSMPTVAEFVDAIDGDASDLAEIQASLVSRAVSQCGSYNKPAFEDPITEDIMSTKMNWKDICTSTTKDLPFRMREFRQLYKSYNKAVSGNLLKAPDEIKGLVENLTKRIE